MWWIIIGGVAIIALIAGYLAGRYLNAGEEKSKVNIELEKLRIAQAELEAAKQKAELQAKEAILHARETVENEMKTKRQELTSLEERLSQRELNLEKKVAMLDKKYQAIEQKEAELQKKETDINQQKNELEQLIKNEREKLQRIANMTPDEARRSLLARIEDEMKVETSTFIKRRYEEAKETAEREARKIIAQAIQRYSASVSDELMTTTVPIASDEVKGRIIGREGRNIRTFEGATGVDVLVDDTPEAVVLSSFDPLRREVARQALERLIADGRIQPGRIEDVVAKVREEVEETLKQIGEKAVFELGLQGIPPELIKIIGRLKFRSSYAQNVLDHSIEVARLMGVMAGELGLDVNLAKKIGLLHDIGKALDAEVEGNHAIIGADFLKKQQENQIVINAVASHHTDVAPESIYATLAAAADAISAARPGARSENSEIYLKRLEQLENIAKSFNGVDKCYAIQAGRELRVIVQPDKVDDASAILLARDISKRIEQDLQYPGQIKVTVIREKRCIEYAR